MRVPMTVTLCAVAFAALTLACAVLATTGGKNGRIVFGKEITPDHFQMFTISADGTGEKQITHAFSAQNPDWSPDGRSIAAEIENATSARVATMSADGKHVGVLTPKGFQGQPSFSPDGKWIVYERDLAEGAGNNGVWLMRADGTDNRRVTGNPFAVRRNGTDLRQLTPYSWEVAIKHDWSPDGKLIVLTTNADSVRPSDSANLVTIHPDGTGKTNITKFKGGAMNAFAGSFSPDGAHIVFRLESGNTYSIAIVNRDGSHLRRLTTGPAKPRFIDWGTHG
jgi:Tol biopolymer transport system component